MASNEKTYITVLYFQFINPLTSEEEVDFCQKVLDGGVYIAPGYEFYSADPGWCRIVFSTPPATLKVGKCCLFIRYFNSKDVWGREQVLFWSQESGQFHLIKNSGLIFRNFKRVITSGIAFSN